MSISSGRRLLWSAVFAAAVAVGPSTVNASSTYTPAPPEPGTEIPQVTVTFGMRPYADNTFYVIGMEKGWFKDVGITVAPAPYGLKTTRTSGSQFS